MGIRLEHTTRRYQTPPFAASMDPLALACKDLLGRARLTLGDEHSLSGADIGETAAERAQRYEALRFELVAKKLGGHKLSAVEGSVLAAINASLRGSMIKPTPESEQVAVAVEAAKFLLSQVRDG